MPDETPAETPATTKGPTAHPPASVHSLWRLRGYLRPHIPALVIMLVTSMTGVGVAILIPLVIKALIDGPITHHDASGILPLGLLVLGLGVLEAFLIWWRRWVQNERGPRRRDLDAARPLRAGCRSSR